MFGFIEFRKRNIAGVVIAMTVLASIALGLALILTAVCVIKGKKQNAQYDDKEWIRLDVYIS